jgi:hypothetical protein
MYIIARILIPDFKLLKLWNPRSREPLVLTCLVRSPRVDGMDGCDAIGMDIGGHVVLRYIVQSMNCLKATPTGILPVEQPKNFFC